MKLVSKASLGIALALGMVAGGIATPAIAAKAEKAPQGPKPELGKEFRPAIAAAEASIKAAAAAPEAGKAAAVADAQAKLAVAAPLAIGADEQFYFGLMTYNLSNVTKDKAAGLKGVSTMIASKSKMMSNPADLTFAAGQLAYQAGDYPAAISFFSQAGQAGSTNVDRLLLTGEANFKQNKYAEGLAAIDQAVREETAAGKKPPESWYARAGSMAYKAKLPAELAKWTRAQVRAYPTAENWRSALVTYRDGAKVEGQQLLDLMRLMRQTKSLAGERDFFEYAALASERALPGEAVATIEEGFASNVVKKDSRAVNEMLTLAKGKIAADRASIAVSEKQANAAGATGKPAAGAGDAFLGYGEDAKAIPYYKLALKNGSVDADQVNTRLGIALARSGQKEEARKYFSAVTTGPRAEIAKFWLLYLDTSA